VELGRWNSYIVYRFFGSSRNRSKRQWRRSYKKFDEGWSNDLFFLLLQCSSMKVGSEEKLP
jgi:hypothetical protein